MNGINIDIDKECLPKLPTGICGLDKVLYGGIDVNVLKALHIGGNNIPRTPLVIAIKGSEDDNDKSVLAMQMLYGIAQSVEKIKADYQHINNGWNQPVM